MDKYREVYRTILDKLQSVIKENQGSQLIIVVGPSQIIIMPAANKELFQEYKDSGSSELDVDSEADSEVQFKQFVEEVKRGHGFGKYHIIPFGDRLDDFKNVVEEYMELDKNPARLHYFELPNLTKVRSDKWMLDATENLCRWSGSFERFIRYMDGLYEMASDDHFLD